MTKDTSHLKVGKAVSADPHFTAKTQGSHFTTNAKHVERVRTPDSSRPVNGHLGDSYDNKGPELWRHPINPAAKPNTHTGPGGTKRDSR